jgi:hypothetical protein
MAVHPHMAKALYLLTNDEKSSQQLLLNKKHIVFARQTGQFTCEVKMTSGDTFNIVTNWADLTVMLQEIGHKNEPGDGK